MRVFPVIAALALTIGHLAFAKDELEEAITDAPPLATSEKAPEKKHSNLLGSLNDKQLLMVGLRLDAAYTGGGAVYQGFYLPSVRLTAWGNAGDFIGYRFSLGQTREFSTALLPQVMPVEGYLDFSSASNTDWNPASRLNVKVGMFTPTFNPWWSPDLADLPLPDWNETHRALFLSRDLGAELAYEPVANRLKFFAGIFNGSGIFSLNTNNSKAFVGGLSGNILFGSLRWTLGASALFHEQADPSSVNYLSNVVANIYTMLDAPGGEFRLSAEAFGGQLNDSTGSTSPYGGAAILQFPIFPAIRLFARGEILKGMNTGTGFLRSVEFGPIAEFHRTTNLYLFYQYLDQYGAIENLFWARFRLVI